MGASSTLNLHQKLAKIRAMCDVVKKNKKGYNYTYADITEILAGVTAGMDKYGVSLIPIIVPGTGKVEQNVVKNTKVTKTGEVIENVSTEMLFTADMIFKWVNDENPSEFVDVPWFVAGAQNDPSMACGSGLTFLTRYFLQNFFQIATTDNDVDAYRSKQKEASETESRAVAAEIIAAFDIQLKQFLADNPGKKDEIVKFIGRYVKGSNYLNIKEPILAKKLRDDFNKEYVK